MNLFIDTLCCGAQLYGVGQVLREHLRNLPAALGPDWRLHLIVSDDTAPLYEGLAPVAERIRFPMGLRFRKFSLPVQLAWEGTALRARIRAAAPSLYWRPNLSFPVDVGCPMAVTLHDAAEYDPEGSRQYGRLRLAYRRAAIRASLRRAARILTVSEHASASLCAALPGRFPGTCLIRNAGPSVPDGFARDERPSCYLTAGRLHRHKNLLTLLRAYADAHRKGAMDLPLVLLGGDGNAAEELKAFAEASGCGDRIRFLGYVSETEKWGWYAKAKAFLFPSRFEGFGLPVLEAMACGVPVAVSSAASLPEVAGNAARLLDPGQTGAWERAFASLRDGNWDLAAMSAAGREQASRFRWEDSTRQLAEVFRGMARSGTDQETKRNDPVPEGAGGG
jgi:glycosyltransferase involved in cell wall biosynthesis